MQRVMVLDLEATCWDGKPPSDQRPEIIEIGCVILETAPDKRWETLDKFSILVKPKKSIVSRYCEELTGITHKAVIDNGVELEEAFDILKSADCDIWVSWGDWDYNMIRQEAKYNGLKPWKYLPLAHLNLKALFSAKYLTGRMGLSRALNHVGLPFLGTPHRGADDAENVAELFKLIFNGGC